MKPLAIVAGYLVRNPSGGHVLSILHHLLGLKRLGYDIVWIEHYGWPLSCFDPSKGEFTDDPTHGIEEMRRNLKSIGITRWCYVDSAGTSHGMSRFEMRDLCRRADVLFSIWVAT